MRQLDLDISIHIGTIIILRTRRQICIFKNTVNIEAQYLVLIGYLYFYMDTSLKKLSSAREPDSSEILTLKSSRAEPTF